MIYDYRKAELDAGDRALCDYAAKLTLAPADMTRRDVEQLREHGFSDEAIHITAQVISYFNYINRLADGLGVDLEPWMDENEDDWHARRARDYLTPQDAA